MESYGNDMFLSQEGYNSIDFTLLDRPSTSVASAPESTAALLPDSSFPSFDFLDGSGMESFGVLRNTKEAQHDDSERPELDKDNDWRTEKTFHSNSNLRIQEARSNNSQFQFSNPENREGAHNHSQEDHLQHQSPTVDKRNWSVFNNNIWSPQNHNVGSSHMHQSVPSSGIKSAQHDYGQHSSLGSLAASSSEDKSSNHGMRIHSRPPPFMSENTTNRLSVNNVALSPQNMGGISSADQSSIGNFISNDVQGSLLVPSSKAADYNVLGTPNSKGQHLAVSPYQGTNVQPGPNLLLKNQYFYQKQLLELQGQQHAQQGLHQQGLHQQHAQQGLPNLPQQHFMQQPSSQIEQQARQIQALQYQQEHMKQQATESPVGSRQYQISTNHERILQQQQQQQQQDSQLNQHQREQQSSQSDQHGRQQQSSHADQHMRQQQFSQSDQHARQQQFSQSDQHARQQQFSQNEQQARQQQLSQIGQQVRQQQLSLLSQGAKQQSNVPIDQQTLQLMYQARWQQMQQVRQQSQQLEQQARVLQSQQLGSQSQQQNLEHLERIRQQQVNWLQQLSWQQQQQQQMQQLFANARQAQEGKNPSSLYGSGWRGNSNMIRPGNPGSSIGLENQHSSVFQSHIRPLNVGDTNRPLASSPAFPALPNEALSSQDPNVARQYMAYINAQQNTQQYPSSFSSPAGNARSSAGQLPNLYGISEAGHQEQSNVQTAPLNPSQQSLPQPSLQPSQAPDALSNLKQSAGPFRQPQQQQIRSWSDDLGQVNNSNNIREGPSQTVGNSDASSESGLHNSQQSGWQSAQSGQAIVSPDIGNQNINTGADIGNQTRNTGSYLNANPYNAGTADFFNSGSVKPPGSWSALMQSAVADSPSADVDEDDWSNLNLQKEEQPVESVQIQACQVEKDISIEIAVPVANPNSNSVHLVNETNSQHGVHPNADNLRHLGAEICSPLTSNFDGVHNRLNWHRGISQPTQGELEIRLRNQASLADFDQQKKFLRSQNHGESSATGRIPSPLSNQNDKQQKSTFQGHANASIHVEDKSDTFAETKLHSDHERTVSQNNPFVQPKNLDTNTYRGNSNLNKIGINEVHKFPITETHSKANGQNTALFNMQSKIANSENNVAGGSGSLHSQERQSSYASFTREANGMSSLIPANDNRMISSQMGLRGNWHQSSEDDLKQKNIYQSESCSQQLHASDSHIELRNQNSSYDLEDSAGLHSQRNPNKQFLRQEQSVISNQWHHANVSSKGFTDTDNHRLQGSRDMELNHQQIARFGIENGVINPLKATMNPLQSDSGQGDFKALVNPSAIESRNNTWSPVKQDLTSSQNVLNLFSKTENLGKSVSAKSATCSEQKTADETGDSSSSEASLAHSSRNQPSTPLSPQVFALRLGPPAQRLQRIHGHNLQSTVSGQLHAINENHMHVSEENNSMKPASKNDYQDFSTMDSVAVPNGESSLASETRRIGSALPDQHTSFSREMPSDKASYQVVSGLPAASNSQPVRHHSNNGLISSLDQSISQGFSPVQVNCNNNMLNRQSSSLGETTFTPSVASVDHSVGKESNMQGGHNPSGRHTLQNETIIPQNIVKGYQFMPVNRESSSVREFEKESHVFQPTTMHHHIYGMSGNLAPQLSGTFGSSPKQGFQSALTDVHKRNIVNQQRQPTSTDRQASSYFGATQGSPVPENPMKFDVLGKSILYNQDPSTQEAREIFASQRSSAAPSNAPFTNHPLTKQQLPSYDPKGISFSRGSSKLSTEEQIKPSTGQPFTQQSDSYSDGHVESQASEYSDTSRQQLISASRTSAVNDMQNDMDTKSAKRLKIGDTGSNVVSYSPSGSFYDSRGSSQAQFGATRIPQQQLSAAMAHRNFPSQGISPVIGDAIKKGETTIWQAQSPNQATSHSIYKPSQPYSIGDDRNQSSQHFGNSRLLSFGNNSNERLLAMQLAAAYKRFGDSGRPLVLSSQHVSPAAGFPPQGNRNNINQEVRENNAVSQILVPSSIPAVFADANHVEQSALVTPEAVGQPKQKARRRSLIPWHIDITNLATHFPTISDSEIAWASSTNRIAEKEEDRIDNKELGSVPRAKKRLKFTSQLMQLLIPPLPRSIVYGTAVMEYESVTYSLSRTALRDACVLASTSISDMAKDPSQQAIALAQPKAQKQIKCNTVSKMVEGFSDRKKNLESELSRLDASVSLADLRSGTQEIERLSILSRLHKHHGDLPPAEVTRVISDERESSSDSNCNKKFAPQRYVTAVPMPRNLPGGLHCISL